MPKDKTPTKAPSAPVPPSAAWVAQEAALRKALALLSAKEQDRLVQVARRTFLKGLGATLTVNTDDEGGGILLPYTVAEELGLTVGDSIPYRIVQGRDGTRGGPHPASESRRLHVLSGVTTWEDR